MTISDDDGSAARRAAYRAERAREIREFEATTLQARRLGVASLLLAAQAAPKPAPAKPTPSIADALAQARILTDQNNFARLAAAQKIAAEAKPARSNDELIAAALKFPLDERVPLSKEEIKRCKQLGIAPRMHQLTVLFEQTLPIALSTSLKVAALSAGLANEPENALLKAVVAERDADVERQRRLV